MLSVQRSRMDPFDASSYPFPSPTAPAPGPSLLDDNESKFLDSFFDGISSDHYNNYDFFSSTQNGPEMAMGWDELPPTFMGTSSSFGQQPQPGSHGLPDQNFGGMDSRMSAPSSTPADVLAAATLLRHGSDAPALSMANEALFRATGGNSIPPTNSQSRAQISQYAARRPNQPLQEGTGSEEDFMRAPYFADMVFGTQSEGSNRGKQLSASHAKGDIYWGSDSAFAPAQAFVPNTLQKEEVAAIELSHIKAIEGAFMETRPKGRSGAIGTANPLHLHTSTAENQDSRPKKRRKSNYQAETDEDEPSPASAYGLGNKNQKAIKKSGSPSPLSKSGQKRRKSAAAAANAAAKATRENLTEEQKRENHIKSEQKRRTLIREGFEDLNQLVPGLRGGGFSKSAVLIMAADWLENLLQGNEALRRRLDTMQNR